MTMQLNKKIKCIFIYPEIKYSQIIIYTHFQTVTDRWWCLVIHNSEINGFIS